MSYTSKYRKFTFPLIYGLAGIAILIGLGTWQVQRLEWKTNILNDIETKINSTSVPLPNNPDETTDNFLPVFVQGKVGEQSLYYLTSQRSWGPGYRVISPLEMDNRVILLDRGFIPDQLKETHDNPEFTEVEGNLLWPDEWDNLFTPEPENDIWFARELGRMSSVLDTEPLMVVSKATTNEDMNITPWPVTIEGIPNNHLQYAITWFSLATIWFILTAYWIIRIARGSMANLES
ncbi:MAG: SURF1 family protein [Rhodobacteraceae bacterium]|nr:SURF1 family protein [Paracoccaceae bacterium]